MTVPLSIYTRIDKVNNILKIRMYTNRCSVVELIGRFERYAAKISRGDDR